MKMLSEDTEDEEKTGKYDLGVIELKNGKDCKVDFHKLFKYLPRNGSPTKI